MRIPFTKMQGAGNDFVVLDETRAQLGLRTEHYRFLANRHFGVGADQILTVGPAPAPDVDFSYRIHNADGSEVEHCGNGARCFVRFVREQGLTDKRSIRVQVQRGIITLHERDDGLVTVDMGAPVFDPAALPFVPHTLPQHQQGDAPMWTVPLPDLHKPLSVAIATVSMGNPHAVLVVNNTDTAPVAAWAGDPGVAGVSGQRERGLHADIEPPAHSPARVRARRGRNTGLRHRCLRGSGVRHSHGFAGCSRASRCARRHFAHRMERR